MGIEIDLFFVRGSELTWFCVGVENDLVLMFLSKLTWFFYSGRKSPSFSVKIELDFVSM